MINNINITIGIKTTMPVVSLKKKPIMGTTALVKYPKPVDKPHKNEFLSLVELSIAPPIEIDEVTARVTTCIVTIRDIRLGKVAIGNNIRVKTVVFDPFSPSISPSRYSSLN
jgi:hypothetical protein